MIGAVATRTLDTQGGSQVKLSRSQVQRKAHAIPEIKFEKQEARTLTSFAGLALRKSNNRSRSTLRSEEVTWNDWGNAAATDTPAIFEDLTAARVHPLVRRPQPPGAIRLPPRPRTLSHDASATRGRRRLPAA